MLHVVLCAMVKELYIGLSIPSQYVGILKNRVYEPGPEIGLMTILYS